MMSRANAGADGSFFNAFVIRRPGLAAGEKELPCPKFPVCVFPAYLRGEAGGTQPGEDRDSP
jgi:hypothetical protein